MMAGMQMNGMRRDEFNRMACGWLVRGGIAAVMRRAPQNWYNIQQIDMSGNLPMRRRAGNANVRYSAAYPTGRERV